MATVCKIKTPSGLMSKNYYAFFRVPNESGGTKQIKRATGHQTKKEAQAVASQLEREALAEAGGGDQHSTAILAKVREAGELALKGRLNPANARMLIGEIMDIAGHGTLVEQSCKEWMTEWLNEKQATTKPATVAFYKNVTKDFLKFLGERANSHLETVSVSDIRKYRDSIVANGRAGKTANHKLKCLRSIFSDAVKASVLLQNPAASVKSVNEDDSTPREPFTLEEIAMLLSSSPSSDWKGMILFGLFTGLRITDCAKLKAGNIDLDRKVLRVMPRKTDRKKKIVEIPLHTDIIAFLTENPPSPFPDTDLFSSLSNVSTSGRNGLSASFKKVMINAGVSRNVTRRTEDGAARETATRSYHSLRHTFTSMLANASVSEEVRSKMTGHTESSSHQIYTHLELDVLRDGIDKIPKLQA